MQPQTYDIQLLETESLNLSLTVYTDDAATTLLNLTGYTATFTLRDKPGGTTVATLTSGSGITLGGTAGTITITRTPAQTAAWKKDKGAYDLTVTSADSTARTFLLGSFELVNV